MAIEYAIRVCGGNKTRAARLPAVSRQAMRTKLKELALEDDAEEADGPAAPLGFRAMPLGGT